VKKGNTLRNHDDVLKYVRRQLFAEKQQRFERQLNQLASALTPFSPINIINVLSASHQSLIASLMKSSTSLEARPCNVSLDLSGLRDVAVRLYSEWQQLNVADESLKVEFQKACNA
jgi:hypothetical protein